MAKGFASKIVAPPPKGEGLLTKWSYSTYSSYEQCPKKVWFKQIEKEPEKGDRLALDRGIAVHKICEDILRGDTSARVYDPTPGKPTKLPTWAVELDTLKAEDALPEEPISLRQDWTPTEWFANDAWLRGKVDAIAGNRIIDFKTGRAYPDHVYQADIYATMAFCVGAGNPLAPSAIQVEFWYFDVAADEPEAKKSWTFYRDDNAQRIKAWEHKVTPMLNDTIFPTKPGRHCAWCGFAKSKGGPCDAG